MKDQTVREIFRRRASKGDVGIEIEVEGVDLPNEYYYETHRPFSKVWRVDSDGSLRGEAFEYVLKYPCDIKDVMPNLMLLHQAYEDRDSQVNDTVRAGIHVHINVQHLSMVELFTYMTAYLCLEDILTAFCGEGREGNHFCLRAKDASYLTYFISDIARDRSTRSFGDNSVRYAAMNITAVRKYGSLEFRAMRSTNDWDRIYTWVKALYNLRENSIRLYSNPAEVIDAINTSSSDFFHNCLGDVADHFNLSDKSITDNQRAAKDIALATDWDRFVFPTRSRGEDTPEEEVPPPSRRSSRGTSHDPRPSPLSQLQQEDLNRVNELMDNPLRVGEMSTYSHGTRDEVGRLETTTITPRPASDQEISQSDIRFMRSMGMEWSNASEDWVIQDSEEGE